MNLNRTQASSVRLIKSCSILGKFGNNGHIFNPSSSIGHQQRFLRLNTRCCSSFTGRKESIKSCHFSSINDIGAGRLVNLRSRRCYSSFPKHIVVNLPALSPTMEMGSIISWEKKEGDKLNEGDVLCEIETDKATMAFETPEEGYLAKVIVPAGSKNVPIGKLVCIIVENESDIAAFKDFSEDSSSSASTSSTATMQTQTSSEASTSPATSTPDVPHTQVALPALSPTMEMGSIISWEKKEGDKLNEGDLLAEIETDKATMGFETPDEGYLARIIVPAGSKNIPIGKIVCIIVENQSDIAAFKDFTPGEHKETTTATAPPPSPTPQPKPATYTPMQSPSFSAPQKTSSSSGDRIRISPFAKTLAAQRSIDISTIGSGSGFAGSITSKDIEKAGSAIGAAAQAIRSPSRQLQQQQTTVSSGSFTDIPITGMRQIIADRLLLSKQTIPHYYLTTEIEMDRVISLREEFNKQMEKDKIKISLNDFFIKAAAMACLKIPEVNSSWLDSCIRQYKNVDVSVAVSTPNGLITPIVFQAEKKGLVDINQNVRELAAKARANKLQPQEFQGGTFTISNLGMYGIHHFSAVINPPQACILALGGLMHKVVVADNEKGFKGVSVCYATLSCDHRVVDGAVGAEWLQHLKSFMTSPAAMIL